MRIRSLLLLLCVLSTALLNAQQYSFIQHGVEEGLSQSVVNTIIQDDAGYLWVGTMSGLNRFDGQQFELYDQSDSLAENWVSASFKDSKGNLWFGHWAGGLSVFNWERQSIDNYDFAAYSDFKSITSFAEDAEGNLYIGTDGNGLMYLNTKTSEVYTFNRSGRLSSNYILDLSMDEDGRLWIATDRGLTIKNQGEANTFELLDHTNGLKSDLVNQVEYMGNGLTAVGYYNDGISLIDYSKSPYRILHFPMAKDSTSGTECQSLMADQLGNLWIGTARSGLFKMDLESKQFKQFSVNEGLNYFSVQSIYEDREQNIWVGTELGLNLFTGEVFKLFNEEDGLSNNIVWSVCNSAQGGLWLGTNAGLDYFDGQKFSRIAESQDLILLTVFEDSRGLLWAGTPGEGLVKYDRTARRLSSLKGENILPDQTIYSIVEDKQGRLWIGTKKGAVRYHPETGASKVFTTKDGLGGNNIYRIFIDSKERIWFATLGGDLSMYAEGKFTTFGNEDGINERFIITIAEDHENHLWFGAYGGVIFEYDGSEFISHKPADQNSLSTPYAIISDLDHRLWIGNSQGLSRFDKQSKKYHDFGRREGFLGVEANSNAAALDKNGTIWIGTIMGLVQFNPKQIKANIKEPLTEISSVEVKHEEITLVDSATYAYEDNNFTFKFKGISLKNPESVMYRYQLEGFSEDYSPPSKLNQASYSNLLPGTYTLKVIAANKDGIWNEQAATYTFSIKPPFYMTNWFYAVVIFGVIFLFWLIMRIRTSSLKRAKVKLETVVQKRTFELRDRNDELAQKNKDITDSIRYAKRIQTAILPEDKVFKSYLPDSFVYFRPKDIVSGDFYWIDQVGKKVVVSAIDCTGHGVPGAFMSLVGYNGMNKIVSEKKNTDAGDILTKLDKNVAISLNQADKEGIKDGMDMSLCVIDFEKQIVSYAGANNSLYLIKGGELIEVKANKRAIGSYVGGDLHYDDHEISFEKGDQFYLFSDGFSDQFGGDQGKKFKSKAFKDLLISLSDQPMSTQKEEIGMAIMKWKGELEQVDDIVVLGFRL